MARTDRLPLDGYLRAQSIEQELELARKELEEVRSRHASASQKIVQARAKELRAAESAAHDLREWRAKSRELIASANARTRERPDDLRIVRSRLAGGLRDARHAVHHLVFTNKDRHVAAVRLQNWWRAELSKRIVVLFRLRQRLVAAWRLQHASATRLQAAFRGKRARDRAEVLVTQREQEWQRRDRKRVTKNRLAVKVQCAVRTMIARSEVQKQRRLKQTRMRLMLTTTEPPQSILCSESLQSLHGPSSVLLDAKWGCCCCACALPVATVSKAWHLERESMKAREQGVPLALPEIRGGAARRGVAWADAAASPH